MTKNLQLSDFKVNTKYYITLHAPFRTNTLYLRVIIHDLLPKASPDVVDYITFSTLPSSKHILDECGFNSVSVPLPCIENNVETLHGILDKVFIDDVIYLIEQYL